MGDFVGRGRGLEGFKAGGEGGWDPSVEAVGWLAGFDCIIEVGLLSVEVPSGRGASAFLEDGGAGAAGFFSKTDSVYGTWF